MLPPERVAEIERLIEQQTRTADDPVGHSDDELIAKGKVQLRTFLTDTHFADGATLLRRICHSERMDGATVSEWALMRLGGAAVWDTATAWALEPDPVPQEDRT